MLFNGKSLVEMLKLWLRIQSKNQDEISKQERGLPVL